MHIEAEHSQLFKTTGLMPNPDTEVPPGKLLGSLFKGYTNPVQVWRLFQTGRLPDSYFIEDKNIEVHLTYSEALANILNEHFLSLPDCFELAKFLEDNPDHGYNHLRRVEKWKKAIDANDKALRSVPYYLYFAVSSYVAIYMHDLVELYPKMKWGKTFKEGHDAASALLTLGFLLESYDHIAGLSSSQSIKPITRYDWEKLAWGAAFICLHHSKPESVPSVGKLYSQGIFDPVKVLSEVENSTNNYGKSMDVLFPPYKMISKTLEKIRDRTIPKPRYSENELTGLSRQLKVMSAADKLDGTFPAELAATRSILTMPARAFYVPSHPGLSLDVELRERIRDGGEHESKCDFNRILFELSRVKALEGISPWVSQIYRRGLTERAEFFVMAIGKFLMGDFSGYLSYYEWLERRELEYLLRKIGIPENQFWSILEISDHRMRDKSVKKLLKHFGLNPDVIDHLLFSVIHREKDQVERALQKKFEALNTIGLSDAMKNKITELLQASIGLQNQQMPAYAGPMEYELPYGNYYYIDLRKWTHTT